MGRWGLGKNEDRNLGRMRLGHGKNENRDLGRMFFVQLSKLKYQNSQE